MKQIRHILIIASVAVFVACNSNPNQDKGVKNSTPSGDYSAGNSDSANLHDTLNPAKPNGMDTTGEQTGRMNNPSKGSNQVQKDTSKKK